MRGAAYPGGMVRLLALPLLAVIVTLGGTATAWAHTEITSSQPADGATLRKAPAAVVLTFSEAPLDTGLAVVATGPQGRTPLDATVAGGEVVAPWPRDLPAGGYRVAYRVVADDGHPIEGSLSFTVQGSSSAPATSPSPTATSAAAVEDESPAGIPPWLWVVAGVLVLGAAWLLLSRRGRQDR